MCFRNLSNLSLTRCQQHFGIQYAAVEDESTTVARRTIDVPSEAAINSLRTPGLEYLQQEFRLKYGQADLDYFEGQLKPLSNGKLSHVSSSDLRDYRIPLTALN